MKLPAGSIQPAGARSSVLRVRGLRYHLWHWGRPDKPLLVCCHGWLDTGGSWQFVGSALAEQFHVVAPDWRGFGFSEWCGDHYWFPDYVADLDNLLCQLSPTDPVLLVGHSMGGQATSLFAGVRPDRVRRLVLLDSLLLPDAPPERAPKALGGWLDALRDPPQQRVYPSFEELARRIAKRNTRLTPERALAVARVWGRERADGQIELLADPRHHTHNPILYRAAESYAVWKQVTAPTFFLDAADSPLRKMTGEDELARRRACFADHRQVVIDDCGHMMHHDQPEQVADEIVRFLHA
ncbi:alpha/beta hydrolase [uncultured Abyssibacter sp.]|uniref:alpha/beta fold hydrolase n=1 Tax=uncultured Abyssibacter sp. TaxID=2320202 RepID=UPI0032B15454